MNLGMFIKRFEEELNYFGYPIGFYFDGADFQIFYAVKKPVWYLEWNNIDKTVIGPRRYYSSSLDEG